MGNFIYSLKVLMKVLFRKKLTRANFNPIKNNVDISLDLLGA